MKTKGASIHVLTVYLDKSWKQRPNAVSLIIVADPLVIKAVERSRAVPNDLDFGISDIQKINLITTSA